MKGLNCIIIKNNCKTIFYAQDAFQRKLSAWLIMSQTVTHNDLVRNALVNLWNGLPGLVVHPASVIIQSGGCSAYWARLSTFPRLLRERGFGPYYF